MTTIIDHALGLVLDDIECASFTDERARMMLGRNALPNKDDDNDWWEAKTRAVNDLLDEMKSVNAGGAM